MQLTLSLNRRTHLFIKDGKLFFKLYKQSKFTVDFLPLLKQGDSFCKTVKPHRKP